MLLVLDNVRDAEQVRPLVPGTSGCLVLVIAGDRLAAVTGIPEPGRLAPSSRSATPNPTGSPSPR